MDVTTSIPDEKSSNQPTADPTAATPTPAASPSSSPSPTPVAPAAGAQPAANPTPAAPAAPTIVKPVRRGGLAGIVDEIRDALAGTTTSHIYEDEKGDKYVKKESLTHGQQWMRIASDAIRGGAAGLAAGRGGNEGAAALAGIASEDKVIAQRRNVPVQQSEEATKANLEKYNMVKLKHDTAASEFALTRMKVKATEDDVKFAQSQQDRERELGSADLGIYGSPYELANVQKQDPDFWKNVYSNDIVQVPEVAPDGTRKGIHVFLRTAGVGNTPVPKGTQVMDFVPGAKPGDPPQLVARTLTAPATHNQVDAWNAAAQKKYQDWNKEQASINDTNAQTKERESNVVKNRAEANKFNAEADKNHAEAKQLNEAAGNQVMQSNAMQLVEGTMDPSNLSKRAKTYDATLAYANTYSMQKYGTPFNLAKAVGDYKFATNPQTYNTLNYLNSLTGRDNKSGNLKTLVDLSDKLKRTDFPPINAVDQWAKLSAGNPEVAAYRAALIEVDDQIAKILQGGGQGGGGTSDAKMRQAAEILNKNFNAKQVAAVAESTLRPLLANRKMEIIGDNRYLQQWHGVARTNVVPQAPAGMVSVQIPGQPVGHIPQAALDQFKRDHPNATVISQ
jgi:hypothetical protein